MLIWTISNKCFSRFSDNSSCYIITYASITSMQVKNEINLNCTFKIWFTVHMSISFPKLCLYCFPCHSPIEIFHILNNDCPFMSTFFLDKYGIPFLISRTSSYLACIKIKLNRGREDDLRENTITRKKEDKSTYSDWMESCSREDVGDATGRWWSDSTDVLVLEEADQLPEEECVASSLVPALEEGHDIISQSFFFFWLLQWFNQPREIFWVKGIHFKNICKSTGFPREGIKRFFF